MVVVHVSYCQSQLLWLWAVRYGHVCRCSSCCNLRRWLIFRKGALAFAGGSVVHITRYAVCRLILVGSAGHGTQHERQHVPLIWSAPHCSGGWFG